MLLGENWQEGLVKDGSCVSRLCDWEDHGSLYLRNRKHREGSGFRRVYYLVWDPGVSDAGELSTEEEPTAIWVQHPAYGQCVDILCWTIGPYFKTISDF